MTPSVDATVPSNRRIRKSVGTVAMKKTLDKENATVDVASTLAANRKKSRSKSIGPGGLDALKHGNGNRRASITAPMPRSILKPTAYSVPEIPPLRNDTKRLRNPSESRDSTKALVSSNDDVSNGSKVALRTEAQQQAAAREREERDRRDARRKSLANRRVSFAAEATLHTFHEIEYLQDSTTSTDSSRRASSNPSGIVPKSPDNHKSSRRYSGVPTANFSHNEDDTLMSTIYSSDSEPADDVEEVEDDSVSSSDLEDGTMMTIETEEVTGTTIASDRYDSDDDTSTLDEALRAAAQRASTQRLDSDSDGDDEEVVPSFGWLKKSQGSAAASSTITAAAEEADGTEIDMDMDMTSAVGGIIKSQYTDDITGDEDMSMDVTLALGGILSQDKTTRHLRGQPIVSPVAQDDVTMGATMEFTTAIGRISQSNPTFHDESDTNEDFSMELTTAMGGLLPQSQAADSPASYGRTFDQNSETETGLTMDMTTGFGQIIPPHTTGDDTAMLDDTIGMDITAAIGGILEQGDITPRSQEMTMIDEGAKEVQSSSRPILEAITQKTPTRRSSRLSALSQAASPKDKPESPGLSAFKGRGLRRSTEPQTPEYTISSPLRTPTPSPPKVSKPQAQASLSGTSMQPNRSKSPQSITPRKIRSVETGKSPSPNKPSKPRLSIFHDDIQTGARTPTVVLKAKTRRLSGLGVDRSGLGSPQVTALFEKRSSIGESAGDFVPGRHDIIFEDPKMMQDGADEAHKGEEVKKGSPKVAPSMERHATLNLREMIDSLSPRRNTMKGRKSLHIGSAKGLLGKRPAELDDDDDSEDNDGVKRLKGHQGSPVKSIKLQQPPSVAETTGRLTRSIQRSLEPRTTNSASSFLSPMKKGTDTTPRGQGRSRLLRDIQTVHDVNYAHADDECGENIEEPTVDGRIHLQDFLNMTCIRFMELTTTKRRHTVAPSNLQDGSTEDGEDTMTLERCVIAGACTIPMLELYQHSCLELKNYIAEGRRIVKEIEAETFEDNPPLFREYMSASPEVKALMDSQFKNVKTHARLLSKAMWYEWRSKLQEGLREGLVKIMEDMNADDQKLKVQEELLTAVLPKALAEYAALEEDGGNLEEAAKELADCDPVELEAARSELTELDAGIAEKKMVVNQLRQELESSAAEVEDLTSKKDELLQRIQQAEKTREACRGWTCSEVESLKARVNEIEKRHGWAVTGLVGTDLSMSYKREIEIVFDVASFQPHQKNARIDLWYIGDQKDSKKAKTAEKEFFLQCIRDHVRALQQSQMKILDVLNIVRTAWDKARFVTSQIGMINVTFPTSVIKTSDASVAVTSSLLLTALKTRVETTLHLHGHSIPQGVDIGISTQVQVVYGEHFNVSKVGEFLATKIGNKVGAKHEGWNDVLVELYKRLIARGKKQLSGVAQL